MHIKTIKDIYKIADDIGEHEESVGPISYYAELLGSSSPNKIYRLFNYMEKLGIVEKSGRYWIVGPRFDDQYMLLMRLMDEFIPHICEPDPS